MNSEQQRGGPLTYTSQNSSACIYVAPDGNDQNDGSCERPLQTVEAAQEKVRQAGHGGVTVFFRGGVYPLSGPLCFSSSDSGLPDNPVVYAACPGEEVLLTGATTLAPERFARVCDEKVLRRLHRKAQENVWVYSLKEDGIDPGRLPRQRPGQPSDSCAASVTLDGQWCVPARWPKADAGDPYLHGNLQSPGFAPWQHSDIIYRRLGNPSIQRVAETDFASQPGPVFYYDDERMDAWAEEKDAFLYGYFGNHWALSSLQISAVDTEYRRIITAYPPMYGATAQARYYGGNLLCELSREGEYYIDRKAGLLYIYSEQDIRRRSVGLAVRREPVMQIDGASHMVFRNIDFSHSREDNVVVQSGHDIHFDGCTIKNAGRHGIVINNACRHVNLQDCEIHHTEGIGIMLGGGNLPELEVGNNRLVGCTIHHAGGLRPLQELSSFIPAVFITGAGQMVHGCIIHDTPQCAIMIRGANTRIECCEFYRTMLDCGAAGTIFSGRNWLYRGTTIHRNYFHDIADRYGNTRVISLIDGMSSCTISHNVFLNVDGAACHLEGGRLNHIHGNLYIRTAMANLITVFLPNDWGPSYFEENKSNTEKANLSNGRWAAQFPDVVQGIGHLDITVPYPQPGEALQLENLVYPVGNRVEDEVVVNSGEGEIWELAERLGNYTPPQRILVDDDILEQLLPEYRQILANRQLDAGSWDAAMAAFVARLAPPQAL